MYICILYITIYIVTCLEDNTVAWLEENSMS